MIRASIVTNQGGIGLQLDNGKTPCTVNNFTSLAKQGFFDNTKCHRLTTSTELGVLQCGDPTGTGTGGPGYRFPNEYPTNQYRLTDPALKTPVRVSAGHAGHGQSGPGTNGSQFFLVYKDSQLPPTYTVFGTIDSPGLMAWTWSPRPGWPTAATTASHATDIVHGRARTAAGDARP